MQTRRLLLAMLLCMLWLTGFAQNAIKGTVKDKTGEPLIGVSVTYGNGQGTVTDIDGNFSVNAPAGSTIKFSYVGYKPQTAKGSGNMTITLEEDNTTLEDVVVVGYGTMKRKDLTGAVASVTGDKLASNPVSTIGEALQGQLPGVNVISQDGRPGGTMSIRVRGGGSITQSNEPLYIVDGVQVSSIDDIAADNIAVFERVESKKAMQGVAFTPAPTADVVADVQPEAVEKQAEPVETDVQEEPLMEYNLPAIDWSVGREAFVAEWSARIDAYLAGSPLSGYGTTFAEAAWENGIDPRWSPAISNTESGKGSVCFLPHNAWGWGSSAWGDWDTAIRAHVAGLASGYGYSLTPEGAAMYCPPHAADWYNKTLAQMASI